MAKAESGREDDRNHITKAEAKEALLRSGYLLENRLETVLRKNGYLAEANTAYPDPDTGKSRELDLHALAALRAGPSDYDSVWPVLLIECVNNPQPVVFVTKEPLTPFLHHERIKLAGLPAKIPADDDEEDWTSLVDYLGMEKYHHYCRGRIATQFCSFRQKKGRPREWMALHEGEHFDCFSKLSAAVEHFVDKHFKAWVPGDEEHVNIEFYYPVLVVQGELLDARPTKKSLQFAKADHVQYRRTAIVGNREAEYQIDVVRERFFPKYLQLVKKEMKSTALRIRRRDEAIREAIDAIVEEARELEEPGEIRAAMEFKRDYFV